MTSDRGSKRSLEVRRARTSAARQTPLSTYVVGSLERIGLGTLSRRTLQGHTAPVTCVRFGTTASPSQRRSTRLLRSGWLRVCAYTQYAGTSAAWCVVPDRKRKLGDDNGYTCLTY